MQWLAARLSTKEPDQGKPFLLRVARSVRATPDAPSGANDLAASALQMLVKLSDAAELEKLLIDAPGFAQLPVADQIRYQMNAELDTRVVDALAECRLDQPAMDPLSAELATYFRSRTTTRDIPAKTLAMLLERLPELVFGSPAKHTPEIASAAGAWLDFLATQSLPEQPLVTALNRLAATVAQRNPELQQSIFGYLPKPFQTLPGLDFSRPEISRSRPPVAPAWWSCLAIFAPGNPADDDPELSRQSPTMRTSSNRPPISPNQMPETFALLNSRWKQNAYASLDNDQADPQAKAALAAKLRLLFDATHPRAAIYDLLVATGAMPCPDPDAKALANRRLATFTTTPPVDPAIAIYLFLHRLSRNEPPEQALTSLQGLTWIPPSARRQLEFAAMFSQVRMRQSPAAVEAFGKLLGRSNPAVSAKPNDEQGPTPLSPYDRLQAFAEAGTRNSPASIDLARKVLMDFVDSKCQILQPEHNISIATLVQAGKFDVFLDELKSRMAAAGASELDVQRALHSVHLYKILHSHGESLPFAKRIYDLDPTDASAAEEVLGAATRDEDRPLVIKCLDTLCRHSRPQFIRALCSNRPSNVLHLFTGPHASELAQALLKMPLAPPTQNRSGSYDSFNNTSLMPLFLHIVEHDPDSLKPLLQWADYLTCANISDLLRLADSLKQAQRPQDGVAMLAQALFTPPPGEADDPLRFPLRAPLLPRQAAIPNLTELTRSGWLKPLLEASAAFPTTPATAGVRVIVGLAADPQPATWDRVVKPYLATLPQASRAITLESLEGMIRNLPDSADLLRHIAAGKVIPITGMTVMLSDITRNVELATEADDPTQCTTLWLAGKPLLTKSTPNEQYQFLRSCATPLARFADDTVWTEYLTAARGNAAVIESWLTSGYRQTFATLPPRRQQDIAAILLARMKPDELNPPDLTFMFDSLVLADPPDLTLLRQLRPWLEPNHHRSRQIPGALPKSRLLDLLEKDLAAASPVISVRPDGGSSSRIAWSLAGFRGERQDFPYARKFPFLDGQFDLEILAGPDPDRPTRVATVDQASATGNVSVKLPADTRFVTLLARQHGGGIIRWSHPVAIDESPNTTPLMLAPVAAGKPGATVKSTNIPADGPFFLDESLNLTAPPGVTIELAQLPWSEGPVPVVAGWFLKAPNQGHLKLSFRTVENVEVGSSSFGSDSSELDGMPWWQRFKTPEKSLPPPETENIKLVFEPSPNKSAALLRVADVRVAPMKPTPVPEGAVPLGRIRGGITMIAVDRASNRFAAVSKTQGVGVFDLSTKEFSGWMPIDPVVSNRASPIAWLALAGERIVCLNDAGRVHLVSITKRTAKAICKIDNLRSSHKELERTIKLSTDGRFLAWSGAIAGMHLVLLGDDGRVTERVLETGRIHHLAFNKKTGSLEAWDQNNRYMLPLDAWESAPLQITRDESSWRPQDEPRGFIFESNEHLLDSRTQITYMVTGSNPPWEIDPSRSVYLPSGLVALDRDGNPFHISTYGQITRIETIMLKGYHTLNPKPHE